MAQQFADRRSDSPNCSPEKTPWLEIVSESGGHLKGCGHLSEEAQGSAPVNSNDVHTEEESRQSRLGRPVRSW